MERVANFLQQDLHRRRQLSRLRQQLPPVKDVWRFDDHCGYNSAVLSNAHIHIRFRRYNETRGLSARHLRTILDNAAKELVPFFKREMASHTGTSSCWLITDRRRRRHRHDVQAPLLHTTKTSRLSCRIAALYMRLLPVARHQPTNAVRYYSISCHDRFSANDVQLYRRRHWDVVLAELYE